MAFSGDSSGGGGRYRRASSNKKAGANWPRPPMLNPDTMSLQLPHLGCLGSLSPRLFDETNPFAFAQRLEPCSFDRTEVHKHIATGVAFDKTIALAVIEPLYSTFRHLLNPSLIGNFFCCGARHSELLRNRALPWQKVDFRVTQSPSSNKHRGIITGVLEKTRAKGEYLAVAAFFSRRGVPEVPSPRRATDRRIRQRRGPLPLRKRPSVSRPGSMSGPSGNSRGILDSGPWAWTVSLATFPEPR